MTLPKIMELVDEGEETVLVLHLAGGFSDSDAIERQATQARHAKDLNGRVKKNLFLAGEVVQRASNSLLYRSAHPKYVLAIWATILAGELDLGAHNLCRVARYILWHLRSPGSRPR